MKKIMALGILLILSACSAEADNSRETTKADAEPVMENENTEEALTDAFQDAFMVSEPADGLEFVEQPTEEVSVEAETEAEETVTEEPISTTPSKKVHFEQLLHEIELGLSDLDDLYSTGVTIDLINAENEVYARWDAALNEMYQALKQELSPESFEQLREEQRQWIKTRDQQATEAEQEYHGGSAGGIAYVSVLQMTTKERCYALLDYFP